VGAKRKDRTKKKRGSSGTKEKKEKKRASKNATTKGQKKSFHGETPQPVFKSQTRKPKTPKPAPSGGKQRCLADMARTKKAREGGAFTTVLKRKGLKRETTPSRGEF